MFKHVAIARRLPDSSQSCTLFSVRSWLRISVPPEGGLGRAAAGGLCRPEK
jgi:hypothetical protein